MRPEAMRRTLDISKGLIVAEAVMMGLAPTMGRQVAHDVVYDCCRVAISGDTSLLEALKQEPRITALIDAAELERLVDPVNYLGEAPDRVARLLAARQK